MKSLHVRITIHVHLVLAKRDFLHCHKKVTHQRGMKVNIPLPMSRVQPHAILI